MKTVAITDLKARLSAHLRAVRRGQSITVLDRTTPVATIVPIEDDGGGLVLRRPLRALHSAKLPRPLGGDARSLTALLEERQTGR